MTEQYIDSDVGYLKSFEDQDGNSLPIAGFNTLKIYVYITGTNTLLKTYALNPSGDEVQLITEDSTTVKFYILSSDIQDYLERTLDISYNATITNNEITGDQKLQDIEKKIIKIIER